MSWLYKFLDRSKIRNIRGNHDDDKNEGLASLVGSDNVNKAGI